MASHAEVAPKPVNTEFIGRSFVRNCPGRLIADVSRLARLLLAARSLQTSLSVLNAAKGTLWGGLFGVSQSCG